MNYRNGILLTLALCIAVPLFLPAPLNEIQAILSGVSIPLLLLACLASWLAASSFLIPYVVLMLSEKGKISRKNVKSIWWYVNDLIVSRDADKTLEKELGIDGWAVRLADLASLNILFLIFPFTNMKWFFLANSALILFLTVRMTRNNTLPRYFPKLVLACVVRFVFEFPKTLLTFLALGIALPAHTIYAFMLGSSALYQFKALPNAGGLLELYATLFFALSGRPLLGLVLALTFHLCALLTFVLPMLIVQHFKRGSA